MAGTDSGAPFQRVKELEQEIEVLRERLEEAREDIDRLRRETEELRKELKAAGRGTRRGEKSRKLNPNGRAARLGKAPLRSGRLQPALGRAVSRRSKCL